MQATDTDTTGRVSMCVTRPNQQMIRQLFLIGLIVSVVLSAQQACAADELVPPFGFRWNDSMARVEAVLHGAKAKLVSREKKENRATLFKRPIMVTRLPDSGHLQHQADVRQGLAVEILKLVRPCAREPIPGLLSDQPVRFHRR